MERCSAVAALPTSYCWDPNLHLCEFREIYLRQVLKHYLTIGHYPSLSWSSQFISCGHLHIWRCVICRPRDKKASFSKLGNHHIYTYIHNCMWYVATKQVGPNSNSVPFPSALIVPTMLPPQPLQFTLLCYSILNNVCSLYSVHPSNTQCVALIFLNKHVVPCWEGNAVPLVCALDVETVLAIIITFPDLETEACSDCINRRLELWEVPRTFATEILSHQMWWLQIHKRHSY
jgi:hypothetical protein